jgi:rhodanese-related sulfurtransferase
MRALQPGESIPASDAIDLVDSGRVWLLDVREHVEWQSGHSPAAHHIPTGELASRQSELPDDTTIAVICHAGARSRAVTDALVAADYDAVDVAGGMLAWQAHGGAVALV